MKTRKQRIPPALRLVRGFSLNERILTIRGQKVILDADLAELYGVTTKALNQAIKRNAERFPSDFALVLSAEEKAQVVTDCDHLLQPEKRKSIGV